MLKHATLFADSKQHPSQSYTRIRLTIHCILSQNRPHHETHPRSSPFKHDPTTPQLSRTQRHHRSSEARACQETQSLKIRLSFCKYVPHTRVAACFHAGKAEENHPPRPGATVRSEPRYACVSDRRHREVIHHAMQTQGSILACFCFFSVTRQNWR